MEFLATSSHQGVPPPLWRLASASGRTHDGLYATWERTYEGQWQLTRFRASDFRLLRNEDLAESIARLQRVMLSGCGADEGVANS
jgi:hypothetical protein